MSIISLPEATAAVGADASDATELQAFVEAITPVVERWTGLVIEKRAVTVTGSFNGARSAVLSKVPINTLTLIASLDGNTTWDVSDWSIADARSGIIVTSGSALRGDVRFTYDAGYDDDAIPGEYKQGALVILQHVWETQRGVGGVGSGVIGEEELHDRLYSYSIPRKALEWLGSESVTVA